LNVRIRVTFFYWPASRQDSIEHDSRRMGVDRNNRAMRPSVRSEKLRAKHLDPSSVLLPAKRAPSRGDCRSWVPMNLLLTLREMRRDLQSTAMHSSDAAERSAARHRKAAVTGITSAISRVIRIGVSVITVPLTLHYLGNERFGLWMTISSVLAMAGFADFGIGNGVLNTISTAFGRDDWEGIRRAISSGFAVLTLIGTLLLALFFLVYNFIDWGNLFRATTVAARAESGPAMAAFAVCFALNIPLDVVQRAQLGLQQGFLTNLWQILSSIMALIGILAVIHFRFGMPALVVAFAGAPVVGTAMNVGYFFAFSRRDLMPRWRLISQATIAQIAKLGSLFFLLQVVVAISFSADNFIIARVLGVADVTVFSIPQRMFSTISLIVGMLLMPLWPAYGEAVSRGDMHWVRQTLARTLLGVLALTTVVSVALLLCSNRILLWWVGPQIRPSFVLMLGLAIWTILSNCGSALAMFLNGAGIVKFQVIVASVFGVVCLLTKMAMTHAYGIAGVPWATILTYTLLTAAPYIWYVPRLLKQMEASAKAGRLRAVEQSMIEN
jgi:O-antigen/teichoic acid export membrane protein